MWQLRIGAVLHIVDLLLSSALLTMGWMEEANPVGAAVYDMAGLAGLAVFKLTAVAAAVVVIERAFRTHRRLAHFASTVVLGSGAVAVAMLLAVVSIWLSVGAM